MRIIAGERRGHKFDGPETAHTRPTSDLVRESIFNILADLPEGRPVYDLFAGTGALGLEALSRGGHVRPVRREGPQERGPDPTQPRRPSSSKVAAACSSPTLIAGSQNFTPESDEPALVLIDPPYRDYEDKPERMKELIAALVDRMPNGTTIVVESDRNHEASALPEPELSGTCGATAALAWRSATWTGRLVGG